MRQTVIPSLVFGLALGSVAPVRGQDQYEKYARWWEQNVHSNARRDVKRGGDGKRLGRVFKVPTNPPFVSASAAEAKGVVQGPTFVLGVAIGGQARAYPIHAMGFELLNDTLGDVPIAASW